MSQISLESKKIGNLMNSVKEILQDITYTGVSYANSPLIKKIDIIFNQASKLNHFRIATTLRYIKVELERYLKHDPNFAISRLLFFVNQGWLLMGKTIKVVETHENEMLNELRVDPSQSIFLKEVSCKLVGIQLHQIFGSVMGFTFFLLCQIGKRKGVICTLDALKRNKGQIVLENELKNPFYLPFYLDQLFFTQIFLTSVNYNEISSKLLCTEKTTLLLAKTQPIFDNSKLAKSLSSIQDEIEHFRIQKDSASRTPLITPSTINPIKTARTAKKAKCAKNSDLTSLEGLISKTKFPIITRYAYISKLKEISGIFDYNSLYDVIKEYTIEPLDTPFQFRRYICLENITIISILKTEKTKYHPPQFKIQISSPNFENLFWVVIEVKPSNESLKKFLESFHKSKDTIDLLFGYFVIDQNQLLFSPLLVIQHNEEFFPALSLGVNDGIKKDFSRFVRKMPDKTI